MNTGSSFVQVEGASGRERVSLAAPFFVADGSLVPHVAPAQRFLDRERATTRLLVSESGQGAVQFGLGEARGAR